MISVSDDDINKRIAEFMGYEDSTLDGVFFPSTSFSPDYTKSLDSLIPVLTKWYFPPDNKKIFKILKLVKEIAIAIVGKKSPSRAFALALYQVLEVKK